jgi:hypothetical protein
VALQSIIVSVPSNAAVQVLPQDFNRTSAFILNDPVNSSDTVYMGIDNTVAKSGGAQGIPLKVAVGLGYTDDDAPHALWAIANSGTQQLVVQYHTNP